eukprot:g22188.t1
MGCRKPGGPGLAAIGDWIEAGRVADEDFLRSHGLNKSLERLLKSLSKAQVLAAWEAAQIAQADGRPPRPKRRKTRPADALLATVKAQLARLPKEQLPPRRGRKGDVGEVCLFRWGEECQADLDLFDLERPSASLPTAVLFVLGAVRDMLSSELHAVEAAAAELNLKLVRVRLGATPEFSSKVVRCLAAADLHGLVLPAVAKAVATQGLRELPEAPPLDFTVLHCCELPSSALCEDGTPRGRLLTLLQLCVCTLWRSKISSALSSEGDAAETCRRTVPHLRILFRDGVTLAVGSKFVEGMSSSHRAAPTERQLLDALRERLETKAKQRPSAAAGGEGEQSSLKRFESTTALFLSDEGVDLFAATTSVVAPRASRRRVERLLLIAPGDGLAAATRRLCDEELGAVVAVSLAPSAPSAVVMLQFMHYCGSVQRQRSHRLCRDAKRCGGSAKKYQERGSHHRCCRCRRLEARALLEQLAPTMAAISKVTYHRDVNAHNILAHLEGDRPPVSFGLVDFGLAVDASTWMDVSAANPLGKSEWEYLDVGGDCRYWPVSAWRQFEAIRAPSTTTVGPRRRAARFSHRCTGEAREALGARIGG